MTLTPKLKLRAAADVVPGTIVRTTTAQSEWAISAGADGIFTFAALSVESQPWTTDLLCVETEIEIRIKNPENARTLVFPRPAQDARFLGALCLCRDEDPAIWVGQENDVAIFLDLKAGKTRRHLSGDGPAIAFVEWCIGFDHAPSRDGFFCVHSAPIADDS